MADTLPEVEARGFDAWLDDAIQPGGISQAEAQQVATTLLTEITQIVNSDQLKAEAELKISAATQRRSEAGAFWEQFLADPQAALTSAIDKAFPGDSQASSMAKDTLSGMLSGQFDPESALAAYADSAAPTGFSGPAVVASLGAGFPTATKGLARFGKQQNGPTECSRSLVGATVTGIARIASGALSSELGAVAAAHQTVAGLSSLYTDLMSYLMTLPAEALSTLLVDKVTLLDNIDSKVDDLLKLALGLEESDYAFDHRSVVVRALAKLRVADDDLADISNVLLSGGNFQPAAWDRAEDNIQAAADILMDTEIDAFPGTRQLRIVMGLTGLNTHIQVLLCRQSLIEKIYANLAGFPTNFEASARFDNLFGPPIDQIRCLLKAVTGEMEALLQRGLASAFYIKEKQWYVELQALLAFMSGAARLADTLSVGSSAASLSSEMTDSEEELNSPNDFTALTAMIEAFASELRSVIFKPADNSERLESLAFAIKSEISTQKNNVEEIEKMLAGFKGSFGSEITEALVVAGSLVSFLQSKDLLKMADDLKFGDITNFFMSGPRRTTKDEEALEKAAELLKYIKENQTQDYRELLEVYNVLRSRVRSDKLFRKLTTKAADNHIRDVKEKRLPKNNRMLTTIRRVRVGISGPASTSIIDKALFVNERLNKALGKFSDVQSQVQGTILRATQTKPVSCAAK
jgi:hypothetical protein